MSGPRVHISIGVTAVSLINELLSLIHWVLFERAIRRTEIRQAPIFILGHWRSGTTLLHELMVADPRFASPNTFQCFAPSHFLISEYLMVKLGGFLLPKQRPMDNMEAGWSLPQEDEFALMNLGTPTPYLRIGFPETQDKHLEYLAMQISDGETERWCDSFKWFLQALTYHFGGKRLVLKSPTHTGRIGLLSKLFPDAKFIHLTRDPLRMFPSTVRLWHSLEQVQALQESRSQVEMEEYVGQCNELMYQQFLKDRADIPDDQIIDVSYEDLAADPFATVKELYQKLDLGDFDSAEPALQERLKNHNSYVPNTHELDDDLRQKVAALWPTYCDYVAKTE